MRQRLQQELWDFEDTAEWLRDGEAYTKQYLTAARQSHIRATQSLGTPSMVWHVAFWPTRDNDPHNLNAGVTTRQDARAEYEKLREKLAADLNTKVLEKLQKRGRVKGKLETFATPAPPPDWEPPDTRRETPLGVFPMESIGFTIWWGDTHRESCPDAPAPEDLRVRVQADIHPDFATLTFIIDAGKPWNCDPLRVDGAAPGTAVPGVRRQRIFRAATTVRRHADARLAADPDGSLDILPERGISANDAKALLEASNLLYRDIWDEFCRAFDCRLTDIAGETDKVFANFRGVVLAAPGAQHDDKSPLSRFAYTGENGRANLDDPHPNAVVKAYWPFIRRTRSEADHRDWVACGVFDWRALYITALGSQSEFDAGDESDIGQIADVHPAELVFLRADPHLTSDVPGGYLPMQSRGASARLDPIRRRIEEIEATAEGLSEEEHATLRARIDKLKQRVATQIAHNSDLPRPFHYLLLTTDEPHRRQVGRIVDRVNMLGTVRLYAMKNFSIIRDADVHLRIYGQLLDQIMSAATSDINKVQRQWWTTELPAARQRLATLWRLKPADTPWPAGPSLPGVVMLADPEARHRGVDELEKAYGRCAAALDAEIERLEAWKQTDAPSELMLSERPLMLYRRLLDDIAEVAPERQKGRSDFFALAQIYLNEARKAKSRHDEDIGQLNRQTDLRLNQIKTYIDDLGRDAIGGLPFRINRARYYAGLYRSLVPTLRVGSIDTWWDYEQLASRAVDPPLRFIEDVGDRLDKLRRRLRDAMEAVQTSAIANQTEATRDNTFRLEVIARGIKGVEERLGEQKQALIRLQRLYTLLNILLALIALGWLGYQLLTNPCQIEFVYRLLKITAGSCS